MKEVECHRSWGYLKYLKVRAPHVPRIRPVYMYLPAEIPHYTSPICCYQKLNVLIIVFTCGDQGVTLTCTASVCRRKAPTRVAVASMVCWSASWWMSIANDRMLPSHPEVKANPVAAQCSRTYFSRVSTYHVFMAEVNKHAIESAGECGGIFFSVPRGA